MTASPDAIPYAPISVELLAQRLAAGDDLQLIDVREPDEVAIAQLAGFVNLPLSQFGHWSEGIHSQFEADKETVVLCHHGMRSAQMCTWLAQQGFSQLKNVTGGIDAYALVVDRSVPRY
ncbi:rhodanese-like domain-containing protein [Nodosilinea sp. P-1105]|uniref:rhodanese-like domain-containing protein n=1 Tax=Nodosilinea sp. P-1105 TaxID=2546229 RepID=UPI00146EF9BF|nr:rhodanese-like domain-containing protein [Nodosilinea sp. P-1105]NMF81782.1 rhodanese-related sulfurtransferase [Nodosilinea sp. P-1105]